MEADLTLLVNGQQHILRLDPETPLLYVLRNNLGLNGPKFGCGLQQCGACMVLLDHIAWPSCQLPVRQTTGGVAITTLEGLTRPDGTLHPVQAAFVQEQAAQCGFCLNGMIISAVSLLKQYPQPSEEAIRNGLFRVLCRCSVHTRAIRAVQRAAASG
ncbi:(2Fe-2S)-binding protein [Hymenobacter psychrotolerans]|uniref:Nicotinate dehydrogenase subunit A n=1 Tax=Hymenobacter psychrotolerans DSM 18569 TaxID=1121959 RepID=A0A1M6UJ37_9BACT|nr:(2Fe-2S)-binding protein [Hymenobacter psychrotolerans]SHK69189.1 nicotinate dehydrogenase subunit A [Hymenobacter psychrotolerans DSM 18569]